jgi:uncharacterized protein
VSGDPSSEAPVASPCVSVCVIDEATGLCAGCYRTLEEIASWIDLGNAARRTLLAELERRRALYGPVIEARLSVAGRERPG